MAERTVEIGTLMAIGAKAIDIQKLFTIEACLIGALGGLLGTFLGNAAILIMSIVGVPFDSPFGSGLLYIYPKMSLPATLIIGFSAVVICFLSALAPARKASKVEPVVAFRGQMT